MKDLYEVLGVTKEATPNEIKNAYRKLSLQAHPDRGGSTERMQHLNAAYEVLSDPTKRRHFDASLDAAREADVDEESAVDIVGHLRQGKTIPYSFSFKAAHTEFFKQCQHTPLPPREKEKKPFNSTHYSFSGMSYAHIFDLLHAKRDYSQLEAATVPKGALTIQLAVKIVMDFLSGHYYGPALTKLIDYLSQQVPKKGQQVSIDAFYQGIFEIIALAEKPVKEHQSLVSAMQKLSDFAKRAPDGLLPILIPLFYDSLFRNLFAYALTLSWDPEDGKLEPGLFQQFDGYEETKNLLLVLKERLSSSSEIKELTELIRYVKLLFLFEKDKHRRETDEKEADAYRESAFHCLDWIPALLEKCNREVLANIFLQVGFQLQRAASVSESPTEQMADEQLALKLYLTAVGIASHCTPNVEIYINTAVIKGLSSFTYQNKVLQEILPVLKERTLNLVDVFPFLESPKSNITLVKEEHKTLHLMRRLLKTMVAIYDHNKSHAPAIPLGHDSVTILYQAYEACLKNWYQEEYDPVLENQFRVELMEELLFDNGWTFLDVEQRVTSPWIMVDRNKDGWLNPTRTLPFPKDEEVTIYRAINGAKINYKTGEIEFYLTPWSQDRPSYERLFTLYDFQEMLEKNLQGAIFSLDPADANKPYHPFNKMRYAPNQLLETELFNTMLLTDYILKFLTTGQEVQGYYPFAQQPVDNMIQHLPGYLRKIIKDFQSTQHSGQLHRFWIEAEELNLFVDEQGQDENKTTRIGVDTVKMVVKKHRMERDINGELHDVLDDEEGWPIYVLTPQQFQELSQEKRTIIGHAMIFIHAEAKLYYWENQEIVKTFFPSRDYRDTLIRLYTQPRDGDGKVIANSSNMPLIYKVTTEMAQHAGMPNRYSPEFIFAHKFTTHYDEFAQYLPEFGRLRELSRISALVRYLSGIRQANKESIQALNALLGISFAYNYFTLPAYKLYQQEQDRVLQHTMSTFKKWREQIPKTVLGTMSQEDKWKLTDKMFSHFPHSLYADIEMAFEHADDKAVERIAAEESKHLFHEQREKNLKLAWGFFNAHFSDEEEQNKEVTKECLWVPASVRHEVH